MTTQPRDPKTLEYWEFMVRAYVAHVTPEQVTAIAEIALRDGCGVWHATTLYARANGKPDARCFCARCMPGVRFV